MDDIEEKEIRRHVFFTKGMQASIPEGEFSIDIDEDGKASSSITFHVFLDVSSYWLEISFEHLLKAEQGSDQRGAASEKGDANGQTLGMEIEFMAAMQSCVASAIAIDAFYESVKDRIDLPQQLISTGEKKRRPSRSKVITETLRYAFNLKPKGSHNLSKTLKQTYHWRDMAVHPRGRHENPMYHPELDIGTEWRFVYYRFSNAKEILKSTISIIHQLTEVNDFRTERLEKYTQQLNEKVLPILGKFEGKFGPIR